MQYNASPDLQDSGTTDDRDETDTNCGCTPLMACWQCTRDDDRGRPAIRRVD